VIDAEDPRGGSQTIENQVKRTLAITASGVLDQQQPSIMLLMQGSDRRSMTTLAKLSMVHSDESMAQSKGN
jgi:hypothetical protein